MTATNTYSPTQKLPSENGFAVGARVEHIGSKRRGTVAETDLGKHRNKVRVMYTRRVKVPDSLGSEVVFQTALSIIG